MFEKNLSSAPEICQGYLTLHGKMQIALRWEIANSLSDPAPMVLTVKKQVERALADRDVFQEYLSSITPIDCDYPCVQGFIKIILEDQNFTPSQAQIDKWPNEVQIAYAVVNFIFDLHHIQLRIEAEPMNRDLNWLFPVPLSITDAGDQVQKINELAAATQEFLICQEKVVRISTASASEVLLRRRHDILSKLFEPGHYDESLFDVSKLLQSGDENKFGDVKELYIVCQDLQNEGVLQIAQSPYFARHILLGYAIGIKNYLDHIRKRIEPKKKEVQAFKGFKEKDKNADDRFLLTSLRAKIVEICIMQLTLDKFGRDSEESIFKDEDARYFLQANFQNFGEPIQRKKLNVSLKPTHLALYMAKALRGSLSTQDKVEPVMTVDGIVNLLKENFFLYEGVIDDTIRRYMNEKKSDNTNRIPNHLKDYHLQAYNHIKSEKTS